MSTLRRALVVAATALYPFVVLGSLLFFKASPRALSFCLVAILVVSFLAYPGAGEKGGFDRVRIWASAGILTGIIVLMVLTNSAGFVKLYPVFMNIFLLGAFGFTLIRPPSMALRIGLRIASLAKKSLPYNSKHLSIDSYCRILTAIWCGFFVFNACISLVTAFWASDFVWAMYNGFISYILIGLLFFGEMGVRAIRARS
jgi:uncharacterized membrane protein